ncbi:uncharacterized protein MYCFIDRAFT_210762 [Pseudocercospora fijiensis CIRAD86]|uniref:Uncharacterized protein n=1 Tax=Pseudocercospora fijiensis (strain CIRAD86) TaxID=383855 RepID=M3B3Q2_PSEFD|nr:uncharacterized protein MYCFIDRAFT_210762 [Pseudocercospora fijiensis CIRAD86]EME84013.1 hypothetical protein MYCFIDRAFT_210762 [Pseudocercospora fijiensis CIRAD86]
MMRISFKEDHAADQEKVLVEHLAEALFESKFWQQFGMRASSKQCTDHLLSDCHEFAIHLEHDDASTTSQRQHKLQQGVPVRDVRPPKGVEAIHLNCVCFDLQFSRASQHQRPRPEDGLRASSSQTGRTQPEQESVEDDLLVLEEDGYRHVNESFGTRMTKSLGTKQHGCPAQIQDDGSEAALNWTSVEDSTSSQQLKRTFAQHARPSIDAHAMRNEYLDSLWAALMNTIDRPVKRPWTTAKVISHESPRYLSECFPTLWAPGYLEHISTRAALLPTITHSLSHVCGAQAKSLALRSKLAELCRRAGSCSEDDDANDIAHETQSVLQPPLSLRLWHILNTNAHGITSASPPKPISTSDLTPGHGHSADEDVLESKVFQDILPPRPPEKQFDESRSDLDDEILDRHSTTAGRWSVCSSSPESLACAWRRGLTGEIEDGEEQDAWPRDAHEELDVVEDDLSSICESVGSLDLLDVAEQHQMLICDGSGAGTMVGYSPCVEPLVVDMDDEMLL